MDTLKFWGKTNPYKSLIHHMIDTGCIAKVLLTEGLMNSTYYTLKSFFKNDKKLLNTIAFYISLHDLGKCHERFQSKNQKLAFITDLEDRGLLSLEKFDYRHEIGTKNAFKKILKKFKFEEEIINMLCFVLRLHHQHKSVNPNKQRLEEGKRRDYWENQQKNIFTLLSDLFNADITLLEGCSNCDGAAVLLWGLTILSDWLASGQDEILLIDENLSLEEYYNESEKMAKIVIKNVGLERKITLPKTSFCGLWKAFSEDSLRPLQSSCEELVKEFEKNKKAPGLIILEAPMGEGKTEAALFLASHLVDVWDKNGLYIAMPTAATSNQMYERMSNLLRDHNLKDAKLIHSTSWLIEKNNNNYSGEKEDEDAQNSWLAPSRRAILSQFGVGTIDQIMMSILKIKHTTIRLLGMESKVIIMDEVHAYDTYMYTIIERLIKWCSSLNIPIILLSATLPSKKKESLIKAYSGKISTKFKEAYPLITSTYKNQEYEQIEVNGSYMSSKVEISLLPYMGKWDKVADRVLSKVENGGCICVLLNTVIETQKFYQELVKKNNYEDIELILFHARFPAEERQRIENKCKDYFGKNSLLPIDDKEYKSRPKKAILVATQVVEQSLDLDFDGMIIALAPIDLLLQRIGRVHRHIGRVRPDYFKVPKVEFLISEIPIEKTLTGFVYESCILEKTEEILKGRKYIEIPKDIRHVVESVYNAELSLEQSMKLTTKEDINASVARKYMFNEPHKDYFFIQEEDKDFVEEDELAVDNDSKTRLGSLSIRIAIIPLESLKSIKENKRPSKEFAEEVLKRTVSIGVKSIEKIKKYSGFEEAIEGEGLLKGIWILPSNNKKYTWKYGDKIQTIIEDDILGIIIEEGKFDE